MTSQANLALVTLVTQDYINSADTSTDLVYFTIDAHKRLSDIIEAVYSDKMTAGEIKATRDAINMELMHALQAKLQ